MTVSVPFSADPNQVLEAFRRIQEEARKTGRELKGLGDAEFPGLDDARRKLEDLQRGFEQMFSKVIRGDAAGALRSGNKNGLYDKDVVSWLGNVSAQFPDQKELMRHLKAVIEQAGRLSQHTPLPSPSSPLLPNSPVPNPSSPLPGGSPLPPPYSPLPMVSPLPGGRVFPNFPYHPMGPGRGLPNFPYHPMSWGGSGLPNYPYHPMNLGGGGGMVVPPGLPSIPMPGDSGGGMGFSGMLPMARALLPILGVGAGIGFATKKIGDGTDEAIGMSALRRAVNGTNEEFDEFKDHIRQAGAGMALNTRETLALANTYAKASGAIGADRVAFGAHEGARLARERGLDPTWGANAVGRATWLGVGKDETASFRKLADIMAGSGLGARQGEAAEAMIRFTERSNLFLSGGGNTEGFAAKYMALINSDEKGIKTNAEGILGGFDSAVRNGGMAGDAGRNLMWNALSQHGVNDPIQMMRMQQRGFFGKMDDGAMIGDVLHKYIKGMGGGKDMQAARLSGFFGGNLDITGKALDIMERYRDNPKQRQAEIAKLQEEQRKSDPGYRAAQAAAELDQELVKALDGLVEPITNLKNAVITLTKGVNTIIDLFPSSKPAYPYPEYGGDVGETSGNLINHGKTPMMKAAKSVYGAMAGSPGYQLVQDQGFMEIVNQVAKQHGVTVGATKHTRDYDLLAGKGGVDHLFVSSKTEQGAMEFMKAVTEFAGAVREGIEIHVTSDGKASAKGGKGAVPYPKHR